MTLLVAIFGGAFAAAGVTYLNGPSWAVFLAGWLSFLLCGLAGDIDRLRNAMKERG